MPTSVADVDFVARLADAWNGKGPHTFTPPTEHHVLLRLAGLPDELAMRPWNALAGGDRYKLLFAARRAVELGRACAWVFGEGRGA
jgi:hypothetical protein